MPTSEPLERDDPATLAEENKEALKGTEFPEPSDEELLEAIRRDFKADLQYWEENRKEAATDSRYYAGDPWEPSDREERESVGRPCETPDELSQYVNDACNNYRQNKRAAKVTPKGYGANDEDAVRRSAIIRGIEYESTAQEAYTTAFEQMVTTGFLGAWRITTDYISDDSDEQMPLIRRIPNGACVLPDPYCKKADFSDMKRCTILDAIPKSDFARDWPEAQKKSFTKDDMAVAQDWFQGDNIIVAECWRVLYGKKKKVGARTVREMRVMQYFTNGIEILERNRWLGSRIPILLCVGRETYINDKNGNAKRMYLSLIRKARSAQMMLCYLASQEAEEFGMAPRAPVMGYVGQFETDLEAWKALNKQPVAFIQVDPVTDTTSKQILPLPTRPQFSPNIQAYEIAYERWRRGVQSGIGQNPLPTAAQRQNEKSGVALEKIQTAQAVGNFHFLDNFHRALENSTWQLNELIDLVIDTPRHVPVYHEDGTHGTLFVTPHEEHAHQEGVEEFLLTGKGRYGVTLSTGPSFQSQREEASSFVDLLIANIKGLPVPPAVAQQLLGLAIKLKDVGPIGDEIAKLLMPPDQNNVPPQAQQAIAQAQGMVQQLQGELQKLMQEREGKVLENQYKLKIVEMEKSADVILKKMQIEADLAKAEVTTKAQILSERESIVADVLEQLRGQAHEISMQARDHAQEAAIQDQAAQNAQSQQQTQIAADQQAAQSADQGAQV